METKEFSNSLRKIALKMVYEAQASHIGSVFSIADILSVLYNEYLDINEINYKEFSRDRFILSKGHACVGVYSALRLKGIITEELVSSYAKDDSILMSHISHKVPGVEFSTGSLGHGLSFGVGMAMGLRESKVNSRVVVLLGDGEMQEGSNWEAMMFAAHHDLNQMTMIIDSNNLQSLTTVDQTLSLQPLAEKVESFGWNVFEIDGHSFSEISNSLFAKTDRPKCIIAKTVKGKGVSFMENLVEWHYRSPNNEMFELAMEELNA